MRDEPHFEDLFDTPEPADVQLQTQCPDCSTVFRITADELAIAQGWVRCGECNNVFSARARLQESPVEPPEEESEPDELLFDGEDDSRPRTRFFLPEVEQTTRAEPARRPSIWRTANAVLVGLLVIQVIWFSRNSLAVLPGFHQPLSALCKTLGCTIEARRDLSSLTLLNRNVYSHPNAAEALIISATIVNNADFSQQYPVLAVSMANVRGETLAQRYFRPADYLPLADVEAGMTPGAPISVALQVADPGAEAMTFEIDFY